MAHPVLGIDHAFLLVRDLDTSAGLYRRLGFTLSPRGTHSPQKGTANHTIVFRDDYLELLGIVAETEQNGGLREKLVAHGEGLHAIANRAADADAAKPALAALGIATGEVSAFSRPLPLPGGGEGLASFRTLGFDPAEVPIGHFFLCQHETPDLVWRPELQDHANGAIDLGGFVGIVADPQATATTYARFYRQGNVTEAEGGFRVETGDRSAPLLFLDREAAKQLFPGQDVDALSAGHYYAALRIAVGDVDRTRHVLNAADIPFVETGRGSILVAPAFTGGVILEFLAT